jgi:hypothetical protein
LFVEWGEFWKLFEDKGEFWKLVVDPKDDGRVNLLACICILSCAIISLVILLFLLPAMPRARDFLGLAFLNLRMA